MAGRSTPTLQFEPLGESMLLVRFGSRIERALNAGVHRAAAALRDAALPGVHDLVPSYATLALVFDPFAWTSGDTARPAWQQLAATVERVLADAPRGAPHTSACIEIPVCYGGECGADLETVARHAGLSPDEVVARHVAARYQVAMLGFAPGFAYLLGLDPALHVPRRAEPRTRVPPGSVAIGGAQTGIYPRELPGGWQLIGRTPRVLFDAARERPALLAAGDEVRFVAMGPEEFAATCAMPDPVR